MRGLIQRVTEASVRIDGQVVGSTGQGLMLLLAVEKHDDQARLDKLLHKIINYRIFADDQGKMNRSLLDIQGGLLVVSQFTLAADTGRGLRPSFTSAAPPDLARELYERFVAQARGFESAGIQVASGRFAADMQVALVNDGPVTFMLES